MPANCVSKVQGDTLLRILLVTVRLFPKESLFAALRNIGCLLELALGLYWRRPDFWLVHLLLIIAGLEDDLVPLVRSLGVLR